MPSEDLMDDVQMDGQSDVHKPWKTRVTSKPQKLGERPGTDPATETPRGTNPADTLVSDFGPQSCEGINVCCLSCPVWGALLREPQDTHALHVDMQERGLREAIARPSSCSPSVLSDLQASWRGPRASHFTFLSSVSRRISTLSHEDSYLICVVGFDYF